MQMVDIVYCLGNNGKEKMSIHVKHKSNLEFFKCVFLHCSLKLQTHDYAHGGPACRKSQVEGIIK